MQLSQCNLHETDVLPLINSPSAILTHTWKASSDRHTEFEVDDVATHQTLVGKWHPITQNRSSRQPHLSAATVSDVPSFAHEMPGGRSQHAAVWIACSEVSHSVAGLSLQFPVPANADSIDVSKAHGLAERETQHTVIVAYQDCVFQE